MMERRHQLSKFLVISLIVLASLGLTSLAAASGGHKVNVCHKGKTLSVDQHALKAHLKHGDKAGACAIVPPVTPPGDNGGGDPPVTPETFSQVNRILACADKPVLRVADNTMGIAVDLTAEIFNSGIYNGVKFTVARLYVGVGATCDNLGGKYTGETLNGYPVWTR